MSHYFYPLIAGTLLILLAYLFRKKKFNRHNHNWKKAQKIAIKINHFRGDFSNQKKLVYLRKIDPFVFEELLLYAMQQKGMVIIRNKKYTGDGGIDGKVVDKNGIKYLIQAKRYKSHINLSHVKEFGEIVKRNKWCDKGLLIHTGKTGKGVYDSLNNYPITVISGQRLIELITFKESKN